MDSHHGAQPERLSSSWTPFIHGVAPLVSSLAIGAAAVAFMLGWADPTVPVIVRGLALPVWLGASVALFMWLGAMRDVWLDGDDVLVDLGGRRVRVSLREVTDIRQSRFQKTKTITLHLSRNTPLGEKVRFVPRFALLPGWADHPVAKKLRARRERALAAAGDQGEIG